MMDYKKISLPLALSSNIITNGMVLMLALAAAFDGIGGTPLDYFLFAWYAPAAIVVLLFAIFSSIFQAPASKAALYTGPYLLMGWLLIIYMLRDWWILLTAD